ncbi:MAG: helix-turn-helix domain-containing protein [Acidimicrobiales bacterium]
MPVKVPIQTTLASALLKEARVLSGCSQRELSRRTGVSRTTIHEIENGLRDPGGVETLRSLLRGTGLDLDVHLVSYDNHDEVLEWTLSQLSPGERTRLEREFNEFLSEMSQNLEDSRRLLQPK